MMVNEPMQQTCQSAPSQVHPRHRILWPCQLPGPHLQVPILTCTLGQGQEEENGLGKSDSSQGCPMSSHFNQFCRVLSRKQDMKIWPSFPESPQGQGHMCRQNFKHHARQCVSSYASRPVPHSQHPAGQGAMLRALSVLFYLCHDTLMSGHYYHLHFPAEPTEAGRDGETCQKHADRTCQAALPAPAICMPISTLNYHPLPWQGLEITFLGPASWHSK